MLAAIRRPALTSYRFLSSAAKGMEQHGIVPDVIDKAPSQTAEVSYPSGSKVCLGNELTPTQVKDIPTVKWVADNAEFYTVCMTDPDAPSRSQPDFR